MSHKLRLIYAIPCQKVIIAANGETSLIGLMETFEIGTSPQAPERFIAPMKWSVASLWTRTDELSKELARYEQKTILWDTAEEEIFSAIHPFDTHPDYAYFRTVIDFPGVPVAQTGKLKLETFLRQEASEQWEPYSSYAIHVHRREVEDSANQDKSDNEDSNDSDDS